MHAKSHVAIAVGMTVALTITLVAAFAIFADTSSTAPGLPVAALSVAVLQIAAVMVVAALALSRARTRVFGWEAVGVALVITAFVIATAATGAGSGLSMTLRPPIGLVGILAFIWFDTGRPSTRIDRLVTAPAAFAGIAVAIIIGLTATVTPGAWAALPCTDGCVSYGLGLVDRAWWSTALQSLYAMLVVAASAGCIAGLYQRATRAIGWRRSVMRPFAWAGIAYAGIAIVLTAPALDGVATELPLWVEPVLIVRRLLLPLAIGGGMIAALLLQKQASRDGLARLQAAADASAVELALRDIVGDPDLRLIDPDGEVGLPRPGFVRMRLDSPAGRGLALIEHRPARDGDEEEALAVAVPAATLALDRIASHEDLRTVSRAERARLERDLHDGAQQHLVALRLRLSVLEARLADSPDDVREGIDQLVEQAEVALDELRLLARGAHRGEVARMGLRGALEQAASGADVGLDASGVTTERMPPEVEEALYFAAREALQNTMKHGRAQRLVITVQPDPEGMAFEFSDVADVAAPCVPTDVPRTIAERISAVGGSVHALSSAGGGRRIAGHVPHPTRIVRGLAAP